MTKSHTDKKNKVDELIEALIKEGFKQVNKDELFKAFQKAHFLVHVTPLSEHGAYVTMRPGGSIPYGSVPGGNEVSGVLHWIRYHTRASA